MKAINLGLSINMETAHIDFEGTYPAEASRLAEDLASYIKSSIPDVTVNIEGSSDDAMDFGATVAIMLGTPAIVILARGMADWIRRQGDPSLIIKTTKGSVTVKGGLDLEAKKELIKTAFDAGSL